MPDEHCSDQLTTACYRRAPQSPYARHRYRNFRYIFEQENVTNAVFLLDLSCNVRKWPSVLPLLYPGDAAS